MGADVREPAAFHLRHDQVVNRLAAGRPVGIEGAIHLIQGVRHLPPLVIHATRGRPGANPSPGIESLDIELDNRTVGMGRYLRPIDAVAAAPSPYIPSSDIATPQNRRRSPQVIVRVV
jgi:hypothetical protein